MYVYYESHDDYYCASSTLSAHSESAFSAIAPKYWNALPYDIRCLKSLFKRKLSAHLLTS